MVEETWHTHKDIDVGHLGAILRDQNVLEQDTFRERKRERERVGRESEREREWERESLQMALHLTIRNQ